MSCGHYLVQSGFESAFTVDASRVTFGFGCLDELGARARAHGMKRVALFTDATIRAQGFFEAALASLRAAGVDVIVFDECQIEPDDNSFARAIRFAAENKPDGFISLGGGSVIDTCKAANLYATYPADFSDYVNSPIGLGRKVPGALKPHIACPTTSGTGSEVTGIAIFDLLSIHAKTGIASPFLRPTEALVDPSVTLSLPSEVVAASGFDVLSHALESYTARPFTRRMPSTEDAPRPMSQGANPWSDLGCGEALRLLGKYFSRAVNDATDVEARSQVMWAATLAGIAFGNAGVHVPHAMSYAVAGLVRDFRPSGYPQTRAIVPHGMSVIVNAPAVFRFTASESPKRHLQAAEWLGADLRDAAPENAGEIVAEHLASMMRALGMPNGIGGVGYGESDLDALVAGAFPQQRLLKNAPRDIDAPTLKNLFDGARSYWKPSSEQASRNS
ncbi:MAG: hydroxyacid-oxoacid transhydrogenase [Polyangiaceae bacterium]